MALVGDIQHDLRIFATRLRLRIDKIADQEDRARTAADIADMIALMDDALRASRAGAGELDEEPAQPAPDVEHEVADRQAAGAGLDLVRQVRAAEASVLGDRLALCRVAATLVDNALICGHRAHFLLAVPGPAAPGSGSPSSGASSRRMAAAPRSRTPRQAAPG